MKLFSKIIIIIFREFLWDKMLVGHTINYINNKLYIFGG